MLRREIAPEFATTASDNKRNKKVVSMTPAGGPGGYFRHIWKGLFQALLCNSKPMNVTATTNNSPLAGSTETS